MVAMVATSLKVTLGAVARHPGADVGYQGVLTGGTVAARVPARLQRRRVHEGRGCCSMMPAAMGTRPPVSIQLESLLAPLAPLEELFFFGGGLTA